MKKVLLIVLCCANLTVFGQVASDIANNYVSWDGIFNGGSGFGAWVLYANAGSGTAYHTLGDAAAQSFGDLDGTTKDFCMFTSGGTISALAFRSFSNSLADGNTFRIDLAIANRSTGLKGVQLNIGGSPVFSFYVGGDQYVFDNTNLGWDYYQQSIFIVEVTQVSGTQVLVRVTRNLPTVQFHEASYTVTGRVDGFQLFAGQTGGNGLGNLYANNLSIRSDNPLPVELTSFSGKVVNGKVNLNWNTATEINNYGFEVERAKAVSGNQNVQFAKVGFVEGNGNSNSPKSYSFTDANITAGKYIYRLKQIDTDGQFEYSQEVEVSVENLINGYVLEQNYPNPFNPSTSIKFGFQNDTRAEVKVYNVIGAEVATLFNGMADAGRIYEVTFDASGLASGTYFYKLVTPDKTDVRKMILMK